MRQRVLVILCLLLVSGTVVGIADRLVISDFAAHGVTQWERKRFSGDTIYSVKQQGQQAVLMAESRDSASGLVKKIRVDLQQYPYLRWRWRTDSRLHGLDETTRQGDDYVARVYVVVSGGLFFWRTLALNYVWSSNQEKGASWPNAFAGDNAMMVALRSDADGRHTWYEERRNVYEDLKRYHGREIRYIDAIAIMTDTDNSEGRAVSYYGDLYFSAE
jgi:hypothetical protein